MGAQRAVAPVLSGSVPPLAEFFHARQETGFGLADGLRPGETILLIPSMLGAGGTGKTQLAVGFAHAMWSARAVELLVWVSAGSRASVVGGYAQAAADLDMLTSAEAYELTADTIAQRFLSWLQRTDRRWAVMLDGVASPAELDGLWPQGPAGQVVVTSRLREQELGSIGSAAGVTAYPVPGFSRREALGYLNARLTGYPDQRIEALDLAEDVGGLPIALSQAAAVVMATQTTCRDYRAEFAQRMQGTAGTQVDGCPPALLATWSLAVEHAHQLGPAGLAWPALVFASVLDTGGIPAGVLTAPAAAGYITGQQGGPQRGGEQNLVRTAYASLERLGLLSVDNASPVRTVWLHSAVRSLVRAYLAPGNVEQVVSAAANGLLEAWPEAGSPGGGPQLSQALRDNAAALRAFAGDMLWKPEAHPLLVRAGISLSEAPVLADAAIGYWQALGATSAQLLGPGHAQSLLSRERLADAYAASGRLSEALPVFEAALDDREATFGPHHPETVTARLTVANALHAAGRESEAIELYEQVLAARERLFGPAHRETLAVRLKLAESYEMAGRRGDSVRLYERAVTDAERELGPAHRDTLTARASLAAAYLGAGRNKEAISAFERTLAAQEREEAAATDGAQLAGPGADAAGAPTALGILATRAALAGAYRAAGKNKEAIAEYERVLAGREQQFGADHPDTITARASLGYAYRNAGKLREAIPHYERVVADRERIFGADHRDTLASRALLAAAYQVARRMREAVATYEAVVADSERALGPGDLDTLTARCNLAAAYYEGGRMPDGITVMRHALADCERYLGPDHAMTATVRESLQAATE
jgi:tetratricopeptide (TPR) repeat protein